MNDKSHRTLRKKARSVMFRMPLMMSCSDLELKIDDYLAADLSWQERMKFELHLKVCRECRAYLAAYNRTIALTGALFDVPYEQLGMGQVSQSLVQEILDKNARK
ncbi:anti-sigma factor [uncultured Roseobacter sp.]|uniref:anti-sigma factor family protein n=1 Tax=uncultured Roseobacter sp. TaxID=114847 RepID=UPI00262465E2|nr:zf-HC2 domain-containing protein [uncultured Roseobacter sp.]